MSAGRRRVVAGPVVAAVAAAVVLLALGNLIAIGCVFAWLRQVPDPGRGVTGALWMFGGAALAQFAAGGAAMLAWAWSR